MGIKVFEFLRRAAGKTSEQFHADWRDVHGPMLANDPDLRRHVKRYELNHRLPVTPGGERSAAEVRDDGWDGVAVLWLDSMDELRALSAEPGMAPIRERAPELHEQERLIVVTQDPDVIVSTPRARRGGGEDAVHPAPQPRARPRHVSPPLADPPRGALPERSGAARTAAGLRPEPRPARPDAAFDGVTEQWFESLDTFVKSLSDPAVAEQVNPDVAYMLDPASIHFVMTGKPTVLIGLGESGDSRASMDTGDV